MSNGIKDLFGKSNNILPKTSANNMVGSDSPIESSEYIQRYIEEKKRFLPTVDFSTASNFAVYGSAEQYAHDAIKSIYSTYPYDGSATEKIKWLNAANYYDLYLFEFLYPRTCGYAVFSPDGWGSQAATVTDAGLGATFVFGLSSSPEYIQLKAGPHADPEAASKALAKQFPEPWDGTANVWDSASGVDRVSNIVLDPVKGWTTEFWLKKDGYISSSATSRFEYIFDVWNGQTGTAEGESYGRHSLALDGQGGGLLFAFASGSRLSTAATGLTAAEVLDNEWHHIAITFQSGSGDATNPAWFELNTYLDGQHHTTQTTDDQGGANIYGAVTGSLIANIGAARIPSITQAGSDALSSGQKVDGYAKLSGSIDEFRFWKTARTPKEISRFWFTQIAGGTNTDNNKFSGSAAPVELGFYYKFNEGNTGNTTTDATVLDYSGRISNGAWTGFIADKSRVAGPLASAMIESSASAVEFKDPIIYSSHPDVSALSSSLIQEGQEWDIQNNAALYHTLPEWITSDDREMQGETLKKLMQVLGMYYDTLQMQIRSLPSVVGKTYPTTKILHHDPNASSISFSPGRTSPGKTRTENFFNKPSPYGQNAVEDFGMIAPEIFAGVDALAQLASRDEVREFERKLYDVKNLIYQSIYNNLTYIYKSKGTEKSFRNLIHCYGVDDDLIKLNLYADDTTFKFDDSSYHSKTLKRRYINFATADRAQATIYQSASVILSDTLSYVPTQDSRSMTFEADVIFPFKHPRTSDHWYEYNYTTSSLFGCHTADVSSPNDFTWAAADTSATATLTFSDKPNEETIITLIDADGTSKTFEVDNHNDGVVTAGAVALDPAANSGAGIATELASEVNGEAALGITATNPSSGVVLLTMDAAGRAGNTAIVTTFNNVTGDTTAFTGGTDDNASFQVHAIRQDTESPNVSFMLTSSNGFFPTLTSPIFQDVYDHTRWTFAVRLTPESTYRGIPGILGVSGSAPASWKLSLYGVNVALDEVQNSFHVSGTLGLTDAVENFLNLPKRIYAGAHRSNFSGSNVLHHTDIKLGSVSAWDDYLSDEEIIMHAVDPNNMGRKDFYENSYLFEHNFDPNSDGIHIPRVQTQILNWQFGNVTGSSNGVTYVDHYGGSSWNSSFEVTDMSSGSLPTWTHDTYDRYQTHMPARGDWFLPNDTDAVSLEFIHTANQNLPEVMSGDDTIKILATDDRYFTRDSSPINYYFAIEKSMAQTVSKEMLDLMGSVSAFNNLIGEPINRYRQDYKSLEKVREMFFRRVGNELDFNRFIDFYKWIDNSLSEMLMELVPASVDIADGIKNVIESHILERNKYWTKFPTLEMKDEPIVGYVKGIKELTYNWKHGHAPLAPSPYINEDTNCLWWKERSEASASFTAELYPSALVTDRNELRRIVTSDLTTNKILATGEYTDPIDYPNSGLPNAAQFRLAQSGSSSTTRQEYKGSTFALRRFSKPYKMEIDEVTEIHGGINYPANKRRSLSKTNIARAEHAIYYSTPAQTDDLLDCDDVTNPSIKQFHSYAYNINNGSSGGNRKGSHHAPFNLVSSSVTTNASLVETGIDIVNLHTDAYGDMNEVPMQGPFTERHVGGMAHRHQNISDSYDNDASRTENFRFLVVKDTHAILKPGNTNNASAAENNNNPFDRFYRDGIAKRPVNIKNIKTTPSVDTTGSEAQGNYYKVQQLAHTQTKNTAPWFVKLAAATGSAGLRSLLSGKASFYGVSDTPSRPKLRYFAHTLADTENLGAPFSEAQTDQLHSPHTMIERFSAPGGPDTAGDSGGGFGLDWVTSQYSPNNALPWRNRAVREPLHAMLSKHSGLYGSFSGSTLSATEATTALSASYHKVNRNVDYSLRQSTTAQSYASKSMLFDGNNDYYDATVDRELKKFTVSAWVHPETTTGVQYINHIYTTGFPKITDGVANLGPFILYTYNGRLSIDTKFSANGTTSAGVNNWYTGILSTEQWHHIVVVWDQDGSDPTVPPKLYLNGVSTALTNGTHNVTSPTAKPAWHWSDITTFRAGYGSATFEGYIQDMSLWDTALTPDQVKQIHHLPNYDAAGPGDLATLSNATSNEATNSLVGWWRFGITSVSTVTDYAPIGTSTDLLQATGGNQAAINSTTFLPANYYGTMCVATHDNWYVQHPIPANDYGYAWITASADKDTGCELVTTASFITASDWGAYQSEGSSNIIYGRAIRWYPDPEDGWVPVDFAGLNLIINEPVSSSQNTLGYPSGVPVGWRTATDTSYLNHDKASNDEGFLTNYSNEPRGKGGAVLNSINLHRNGPYGYPSWKQLRAGDHPIARNHKKNNILSVGDAPSTKTFMHGGSLLKSTELHGSSFTNYTEPPLSKKYKPITHRLDSVKANGAQTLQPLTLKHSYANNLSMFANVEITNKLGVSKEDRQKYHYIRDTYLNSDLAPAENPTKAFKSLVYAETIYPKEVNTFLSGTRGRTAWAETAAEISSSVHGEGRTFWRDTLEDRMRDEGALNCMGYRIYSNPNKGANYGANNDRNPWFLPSGALSMWSLDTGERGAETMLGLNGATEVSLPTNNNYSYPNIKPPEGDEWGGHVGELYQDPIGSLYASLDYRTLVDEVAMSDAGGTAFYVGTTHFIFSGAPADGATLTVIDYHGTSVTFEAQDDEDDVTSGRAWVDTDGVSTAAAMDDKFKAAFDTYASHLAMACVLPGTTGRVNLNQLIRGSGSNTEVTANTAWNTACSTNPDNFAGGRSFDHFMAKSSSVGPPSSNSNRYYAMPGTASICFNHFCVAGTTLDYALAGTNINRRINEPNHIMDWHTAEFAGRDPWFDSYEDYASDIRSIAQDYTVLPEFRISEHMEHYVTNGFSAKNYKFLSLEGADNNSSADAYSDTYNEQFWKEYCHSDFLKYFGGIQEDHSELAPVSAISFKCSVVKKLLPYNGFYPVQRSVQMASLFSSSYGPYITGSTRAHYGGVTAEEHPGGKHFAEQMQSLLQPFYAPGIMYNTLKSCVAVDYPVHTGSSAATADAMGKWSGTNSHKLTIEDSGSRRYIDDDPNFRMPFEAIIMPHEYLPVSQSGNTDADNTDANQGRLWLTAPYYGSASFFAQWKGQQKPQYSMAANNFFAEVPNFFLEGKTFNSFTSAKESAFKPMVADTTYYMDVVLFKTDDHVSYEGFYYDTKTNNDSYYATRGWGFGPPHNTFGSRTDINPQAVNDPAWAPHAPPYFYGRSVARIKFTPNEHFDMGTCESQVFTLDEILAGAELETEFLCEIGTGLPTAFKASAERLNTYPNSVASRNKMAVTSSVSLFGKTQKPAIEYDAITGEPLTAVENPQAGMGAWVIGTKFECPSLNFYGIYGGAPDVDGTLPTLPDDPSELDTASGSLQHRVRGLFNGYGKQPQDGAGVFLGLRESFTPDKLDISCENGIGSLIDICGFKPQRRRLGRLASNKIISEAVVAIPFVDIGGERKFFALGDTPMQSRTLYQNAVTGNEGPGKSIRTMADRMSRYVLPPHLDFKTDLTIEPFAMYIFEFTHKLSRDDLSNIWQGIMPDISVTAEKSQTAITHETAVNEFFRGNPIPKHTRWMVFKVKRRAKESYFDATADATDDSRYTFTYEDEILGRPDYTYNWPYDFFSLIELAKVDVKVGVGDGAIPLLPMNIFPMDLSPGSTEMASIMKAGALANKAAMFGQDALQAQSMVDKAAVDNMGTADASKWMGTIGSLGNNGSTGGKPVPAGLMVDKAVQLADPSWVGGFFGGPIADATKLLNTTSMGNAQNKMNKAGIDMAGKTGGEDTSGQGNDF